ncbi:MAG: MFS transporter [Rickettsiaceae bacterium]|nr:MFS transporter [Rickettsiaceae bacterium]
MRILFLYCGTTIQFFNYGIFGLAAGQLSSAFLPGQTDIDKISNFFFLVILSNITRPLASFIFGTIGDKFGRKRAIIFSSIISGIGAILVAFIPSYNMFGIFATILLALARIMFLSGLTGDIDGIRVYISEIVPKSQEYLANGIISVATQLGVLAASLCIFYLLKEYEIFSYIIPTWRLCFFFGGLLTLLFSVNMLFLNETSVFLEYQNNKHHIFPVSFAQIFHSHSRIIIYQIIIFGSLGSFYHFFIICLPLYIKIISQDQANLQTPVYLLFYAFGGVLFGYLFDYLKFAPYINFFRFLILIIIYMIYYDIKTENYNNISTLVSVICFIQSGVSVASYVYLKNYINIAIRYRVFSLSHSLGSVLISAPTNYISTKAAILLGPQFIILPSLIVALGAIYSFNKLQKL